MPYLLLLSLLLTTPGDAKPSAAKEEPVVTHHAIELGGKKLAYTVTTGCLELTKEDGSPRASVFFVAYTLDGKKAAERPLTFSFNGGPGSSSVWLHLGLLGPRIVQMDDEGHPLPPPYQLIDNPQTLLDLSDLVFIDPVSTGYSRAANGVKPDEFHGVQEDISSVAEVIRLYTTRYERWPSAKFLIGESYGTTRAAGLAAFLQEEYGMYLNGVMLVSSILHFQTARFDTGNDLPYILFLPTYTATAFYHHKLDAELSKNLEQTLRQAEAFAMGPYADALLRGDALPAAEQDRIAEQLARFTGLSKLYVQQSNMRVQIQRFTKELLRDQRRTVGRLDTRFQGVDRDASNAQTEFDPSYAAIQGPFTACLNTYMREELGYKNDANYEILTGNVQPWSYRSYQNRYIDMAEQLRQAITQNPHLKVLVANGYYDLATPYFATDYTFNHLQLEPELRDNIRMTYYPAGHMMYIQKASLVALKADIAKFMTDALAR